MATFGRDYTRPVRETRRLEQGTAAPAAIGDSAAWLARVPARPDRPGVRSGLCLPGTLGSGVPGTPRFTGISIKPIRSIGRRWTCSTAWRMSIRTNSAWCFPLPILMKCWAPGSRPRPKAPPPVGLLLAMKNAEPVREPAELEWWWRLHIRLVGPAWAGARFSGDRYEPGPLTRAGLDLLEGHGRSWDGAGPYPYGRAGCDLGPGRLPWHSCCYACKCRGPGAQSGCTFSDRTG